MTRFASFAPVRLCVELFFIGLFAAAPVSADDDHDEAWRLREAGEILPLEQLLRQVRERYPGRVIGVELEHERGRPVYEIELLEEQGRVRELLFDARDGHYLEHE
ncbi:PepSY domain-containing protein [Endothiovibrio diazotrophicus]